MLHYFIPLLQTSTPALASSPSPTPFTQSFIIYVKVTITENAGKCWVNGRKNHYGKLLHILHRCCTAEIVICQKDGFWTILAPPPPLLLPIYIFPSPSYICGLLLKVFREFILFATIR